MTELREEPAHLWHMPRLIASWAITLVCAFVVFAVAEPADRSQWWVLTLGVSVLATFGLQLGTAQREGFINRTALSIAGSVTIVAIFELIALILRSA